MNEGNYSQVLYAEDQEMFDFNFIKKEQTEWQMRTREKPENPK